MCNKNLRGIFLLQNGTPRSSDDVRRDDVRRRTSNLLNISSAVNDGNYRLGIFLFLALC